MVKKVQAASLAQNTQNVSAKEVLEEIIGGTLDFQTMIKSLRLCEEESRRNFARRLSVSPSCLARIESGQTFVGLGRAAKFAKRLGYSEISFLRLATDDYLRRSGLKYRVTTMEKIN